MLGRTGEEGISSNGCRQRLDDDRDGRARARRETRTSARERGEIWRERDLLLCRILTGKTAGRDYRALLSGAGVPVIHVS